jgi:organic radical activating enzyme
MESNGTRALGGTVDWLTVSPKPQFHPTSVTLASDLPVSELKVVIDDTVDEAVLDRYVLKYACEHYFAQPCMNDEYARHLARTIALVQSRPRWRLSVQLHKVIGVP